VVVEGNVWYWREICGSGWKYVVVEGNMWLWMEICGSGGKYAFILSVGFKTPLGRFISGGSITGTQ
jgi:hypothetical protein